METYQILEEMCYIQGTQGAIKCWRKPIMALRKAYGTLSHHSGSALHLRSSVTSLENPYEP